MSMKPDEHGLNERQRRFVDAVTAGTPAGRAYEAAGYAAKGAAADVSASKMLRFPKVAAAIAAERERMRTRARMSKDDAVDWLCDVMRTPLAEVDERSLLAQEVVRDELGEALVRTRIKMVPKLDSLRELAKLLGWYEPERHDHAFNVVIGGDAE
jgi:hypothetical protein